MVGVRGETRCRFEVGGPGGGACVRAASRSRGDESRSDFSQIRIGGGPHGTRALNRAASQSNGDESRSDFSQIRIGGAPTARAHSIAPPRNRTVTNPDRIFRKLESGGPPNDHPPTACATPLTCSALCASRICLSPSWMNPNTSIHATAPSAMYLPYNGSSTSD